MVAFLKFVLKKKFYFKNISIKAHLNKAFKDIIKLIPNPLYNGLAIIDYEHWRPIYNQNWAKRNLYQSESTRQ